MARENREYLGRVRTFIENVEQSFNAYRKEITGAQAALQEISLLRDSIMNRKMSPTEFEFSLYSYITKMKRSLRLKRMLLRDGIPFGKEFNQRHNAMWESGTDVPETEIDNRGDELKAGGLSDQEVIQQLRSEGYID